MDDDAILEKRCAEEGLDYRLASQLKAKIFPLFDEAHRRLGYRFDKAYMEQIAGTKIRRENSKRINLLLRKLKTEPFSVEERVIISLHLEYLMLVEGMFAPEINFLIFTLIANGRDFCPTRKGKKVKTLSDIEKVNLVSRLDFLRKQGFGIITKKINVKLRNSIAHLFYQIEENGNMKVDTKEITQEEYAKLYASLRNISFSLHLVSLRYYNKFVSTREHVRYK